MTEGWEGVDDIFKVLDGEEDIPTEEETTDDTPVSEEESKEITLDDLDDDEQTESSTEDESGVKSTADILKATAIYKAEKYGVDITGVEDWDEETYQKFEDQLDDFRLEQKYAEAKQSNELVEALLTMAENGGDVNDVLELFERKKEFADIDTTTVEGKIEKIEKYYRDVEGWKPDRIQRYMKKLKVSDDESEIDQEYDTISEQYDEYFQEEKTKTIEQAAKAKLQKEERLKKQVTSFSTTLETKKFKKADSKELVDYIFLDKFEIQGTGQILSAFDVDIAKAKSDPERLLDVSMLLRDPEGFKKRIITEAKNEKNDKTFTNIIRKEENKTRTDNIEKPKQTNFQFKL